eukprot:jgi/Chrzof1/7715/Cz02g34010.t1
MQRSLISANPLKQLWAAYERQLHRQPVLTQMTTSAILWGAGDLLAQRLEQYERRHGHAKPSHHHSKQPDGSTSISHGVAGSAVMDNRIDWYRAGMTSLFGSSFVGPIGHFWYIWIDRFCARLFPLGTPQFIASKVLLDTACMGPLYVAAFFAWGCTFIDGGGWQEFRKKMQTDFMPTLLAEITFWPVVQTINFAKVPVHHQLLVVNSMTMLDAAFMSWARNQDDWFNNLLHRLGYATPKPSLKPITEQ